ncbi:hypothetical protein SMD22_00235 (plasmid) [Brevibacillus halotolerans]|nr:hypothetical protein SMD22_00235 [Brevibacillus halotolerans]
MRPIEEERIIKEVLEDCKRERKDLTKKEIIDRGLNIYEKQGVRVSQLLEEAINRDLIKAYIYDVTRRRVVITQNGIDFLFNFYTDNQSSEFLAYEQNFNQIFREKEELELDRFQIAVLYWRGHSVEESANMYLKHSCYRQEIQAYHRHLLQHFGTECIEGKYIFHFMPKLFLPIDWMDEEISLSIEGVETPSHIILTKPYTNKRYIVAGVKIGKEKTSAGFYPIIADRDTFPKHFDFTLRWSVGGAIEIIHKLHIDFEKSDHGGNLYSSEQHLSRSSKLDELHLTTFVEREFWRDRQTKFYLSNIFDELVIEEDVTLTNFPMKLHSAFNGDRNFQKWLETYNKDS